ncbi:DUF2617 family protein [Brevibacterium litoralis]|uniref:DUF2617 family protein n=1 Tax=Brevibacterium litoralis TaxID=3138935 RepID=UPI0032ED2913
MYTATVPLADDTDRLPGHHPAGPSTVAEAPVPFADTRAEDLGLALGRGRLPEVLRTSVDLGSTAGALTGLHLDLVVIGSSHQVVLHRDGTDLFSETLACLPRHAAPTGNVGTVLDPFGTHHATGSWGPFRTHDFHARVRTPEPADFDAAVAALTAEVTACDHHAIARFPGHEGAVTALLLDHAGSDRLTWRTWHCYPQYGQIVESTGSLSTSHGPTTHPHDHHLTAQEVHP